jgi:outer membrane protein, heavy metal efflux system
MHYYQRSLRIYMNSKHLRYFGLLALLLASAGSLMAVELKQPEGKITLQQAMSLALAHNAELRASGWRTKEAEANRIQAGLAPNPQLKTELEDFTGSGEFSSADAMETKVGLSQKIEVGGKRSKRARVADIETDLSKLGYESKKQDVLAAVNVAFIETLAAQERQDLSEESLRVAREVHYTVSERVKAGKVSPIEETRAGISLETARIALQRFHMEYRSACLVLASNWGSVEPDFDGVYGSLEETAPTPQLEELKKLVMRNPDFTRWDVELDKGQAVVDLEEAKRLPDITLGGSARYANEIDEYAFSISAVIPIPFFNRNQGARQRARHSLSRMEAERNGAMNKMNKALVQSHQRLSVSHATVASLRDSVLPGAQSVFNAISEGFKQGKFDYLDLLDAQRTLFEVKGQYIEALSEYHKSDAAMQRLTCQPYDNIETKNETPEGSNHAK